MNDEHAGRATIDLDRLRAARPALEPLRFSMNGTAFEVPQVRAWPLAAVELLETDMPGAFRLAIGQETYDEIASQLQVGDLSDVLRELMTAYREDQDEAAVPVQQPKPKAKRGAKADGAG